MYGVTMEILSPTESRSHAMRRAPHSFLTPPQGNVVIVKGMAHLISECRSPLWRCAQVVRGLISRPGHADLFICQRTSGT